jgi:hypothetical protein
MNRLREQAQHAQQVATAEVQKIVQFLSIHSNDVPDASERKIAALQSDVQQAYATLQASERDEEQARADDLREAIKRYTALQSSAEALYAEVYGAFQRRDELRKRLAAAMDRAERALDGATRRYQAYASFIPRTSTGVQYLEQARAGLDSIGSPRSEQALKQAIATAEEARQDAERADKLFRDQAQAHQRPDSDLGDFLGGVVIGSMLSGGGGRHHHGGGGGWGGGGGGGWGGGSSSGGSWGGGSSSGGSWGGGSSSGGGW